MEIGLEQALNAKVPPVMLQISRIHLLYKKRSLLSLPLVSKPVKISMNAVTQYSSCHALLYLSLH